MLVLIMIKYFKYTIFNKTYNTNKFYQNIIFLTYKKAIEIKPNTKFMKVKMVIVKNN